MIEKLTPADLEISVREFVRARASNLGVEVSVPVTYPSGELVTVYVAVAAGDAGFIVHDASMAAMSLSSVGVRLSTDQVRRARDLVHHYGCEFTDGRVSRFAQSEQVPPAILAVANASRIVADHALTIRRHAERDFRVAVAERLRESFGRRMREHETVKGRSGRSYRVPHVVLDRLESRPIAYVAALPSRNLVPNQFAEFSDLRRADDTIRNESIYDEDSDLRDEDLKFIREVSETVPYSATDRLRATLQ